MAWVDIDVTADNLKSVLDYDPNTGKLFWKERAAAFFGTCNVVGRDGLARRWNTKFAGKEAFRTISFHGYKTGTVFNKGQRAHRVAWAIYYGEMPKKHVDHINGDRTDNRINNLRLVTDSENMRNMGMISTNTSGCMGVSWNKAKRKWDAYIKVENLHIRLGRFSSKDEAIAARKAAEIVHNFHPNHGSNRERYEEFYT